MKRHSIIAITVWACIAFPFLSIIFHNQLNPVIPEVTSNKNRNLVTVQINTFNLNYHSACKLGADGISMHRNITAYADTLDWGSTLAMTMASSAQLELLHVWLNARKRQQLVVLALDKEVVKECCELGIPYLFDSRYQVGSGKDMMFMSAEFLKLGLAKFRALSSIIISGYSVLFSEIDVYELRDPERCEKTISHEQQRGCVYSGDIFDLEIQTDYFPGKMAKVKSGSELNIGFFYLRSSVAALSLLGEVVKCLEKECGWDQRVFSDLAWKRQCCTVDDNVDIAHASTCAKKDDCLRIRILNTHHFPTGGVVPWVVPPDYKKMVTCPVLVHCTSRTGLVQKLACARNVQMLYGNCDVSA